MDESKGVLTDIAELKSRIANLEMSVAPLTFEEVGRISWISGILQPRKISIPLSRVGDLGDGGYVLYPPSHKTSALSLGVGNQISADIQLIRDFDMNVYAFDPYVDRPESAPENFHFHKIGLESSSITQDPHLVFEDIHLILKRMPEIPSLALIDIEGIEWDLENSFHWLRPVTQIVIEFHNLERIVDDQFFNQVKTLLTEITKSHVPIHVHGNNDGPTLRLSGAVWPGILEVTFLSKTLCGDTALTPNFGPWPTPLDAPNSSSRPDLYLEPFFGENAIYRS